MSAPTGNQYAVGNEGGRPSKYKSEYAEQVYRLCLLGLTDAELAAFFGVNEDTIYEWANAHTEFSDSRKKGKDIADGNVADSLYQSAVGYSHPDTHFSNYEGVVTATPTTKHYPPNPTSAIFWLKNRQKKHWRDKVEVETTVIEKGAKLKAWTAEDIDAFEKFQEQQSGTDEPTP